MEDVLGFLGFVLAVIILVLLIEYWYIWIPLVIVLALTLLTIKIVKKAKERKKRRMEEEKQREADRQRSISNMQYAVSSNLRYALSSSTPDYKKAINIVDNSDPSVSEYAIKQAQSYNSEIKDRIFKSSEQGKLDEALAAMEFYCHFNDTDKNASEQKASIEKLINACNSGISLVISSDYCVDKRVLDRIRETSPQECRNSMKEQGIQFCLWFFAIKQPFDRITYSEILAVADQIKSGTSRPLPDAVQSSIFVDTKQNGLSESEVVRKHSDKVKCYINTTDDPDTLYNFASGLAFAGNAPLEALALQKLIQVKPDVAEDVRKRYDKLQQSFVVGVRRYNKL